MSNDAFLSSREAEHDEKRFRRGRRNAADAIVDEKQAPNHSVLLAVMGAAFLAAAIAAPFLFGTGRSEKSPPVTAQQRPPAPDEGAEVRDALQAPGRSGGVPEAP